MEYYQMNISLADGGFGHYVANPERPDKEDVWSSEGELVSEIYNNLTDGQVYELGIDSLEGTVAEDIRGRVGNEPARIFAYVFGRDDELVSYFGIGEA